MTFNIKPVVSEKQKISMGEWDDEPIQVKANTTSQANKVEPSNKFAFIKKKE